MGGRAEGLACADPGASTPIGASGNFVMLISIYSLYEICFKFSKTKASRTQLGDRIAKKGDIHTACHPPSLVFCTHTLTCYHLLSTVVWSAWLCERDWGLWVASTQPQGGGRWSHAWHNILAQASSHRLIKCIFGIETTSTSFSFSFSYFSSFHPHFSFLSFFKMLARALCSKLNTLLFLKMSL